MEVVDRMKIYVPGHRGLVGSAITRRLEISGRHEWVGLTHSSLDLTNREQTFDYVLSEKPDAMIVAAAVVGGIGANQSKPVRFLSENLQIQTNLLDAAHEAGVERVIFLGSSCIYPKMADQPIRENSLMTGPLESTNEAYAIAKIAGLTLTKAYRIQYQHDWISAMPTNLYGINDNFDSETSHVLPSLIGKFHAAKSNNANEVTLWGTGEPRREFLHSDDLASAIEYLLESYSSDEPINIGIGEDITIRELATVVAEIVGYSGDIIWDSSKPNGTPRKVLDVSRIRSLGWEPKIDLKVGIQETYEWYLENVIE